MKACFRKDVWVRLPVPAFCFKGLKLKYITFKSFVVSIIYFFIYKYLKIVSLLKLEQKIVEQDSQQYQEAVENLIKLESFDLYIKSKRIINQRNNVRGLVRRLCEDKAKLPEDSEFEVKLKETGTYTDRQAVISSLQKRYNIPGEELDKVIDNC